MRKSTIILALILMFSSIGCLGDNKDGGQPVEGEPEIHTQDEASEAMTNISEDIEDVSKILEDIDKSLG